MICQSIPVQMDLMTTAPRKVPLALTVGGVLQPWPGTNGNIRVPFSHGATVPRWRIHFHNINPREGTPGYGRYTVPAVALGRSNGKGGWESPPTVIANGLSGSGTSVVTPWHDIPLVADAEYLLAYTWSAEHPTKRNVGGGWVASDLVHPDALLAPTQNHPLDVWIEAEVPARTPVIAVFGDSVSAGVTATVPVRDSWLSVHSRQAGALPIHYSASGDGMKGWSNPAHHKWQRWQHLSRPDAVVHAMGLNDVNGGHPIWELQRRHHDTMRLIREMLSSNIRTATITPATRVSTPLNDSRRTYNAWLMGRYGNILRFHDAVSRDDRRLSPGFDVDGIHMNTSGYRAMASKVPDLLGISA